MDVIQTHCTVEHRDIQKRRGDGKKDRKDRDGQMEKCWRNGLFYVTQ